MSRLLHVVPALLAAVLLAAHFSRAGQTWLVAAAVLLAALVLVPHPTIRLVVRAVLIAGALEWLRTVWTLVGDRLDQNRPFIRLLVILLAVVAWTIWSAWLLPVVRRAPKRPGPPV
ncbi:MAG: hypothetical protein JSV80_00810 [Acidobacteriota bacterium]|nr:MAG: hypothetical protein JSV80_00810 [Acidobacteriota bacterium]